VKMKNGNKSESIRQAIESAVLAAPNQDEALARVLETLENQKIFRYQKSDTVNLLSTAGRVMTVLLDDNTMTQRALGIYLNLSSTMITRTIKTLMGVGLITRTKVNRQNVYEINYEAVLNHPDIQQFVTSLMVAYGEKTVTSISKRPSEKVVNDDLF